MNMYYKLLTISLFCIFSFPVYSQSNFKKGYIVSVSGDTVKGYIDYKDPSRTPGKFMFKSSLEEKSTTYYTPHSAQKIVIEEYDMFESFEVLLSMDEIEYHNIEVDTNPVKKKDTVFLKVVGAGDRINLYSYRDELKDRFFILPVSQTKPVELEYKIQKKDDQLTAINTYRIQLNQVASKYPDYTPALQSLIATASYSRTDLKNIEDKINTINEKASTSLTKKKYKKGRFFVSAGLNYSGITYKGKTLINANGLDKNGSPAWREKTTTHSLLPAIALGYDIFFHPAVQRSYIRTELAITAIRSKVNSLYKFPSPYTEELTNKYNLSGIFVSFSPLLIYSVYHKQNLGFYIGGGLSVRYSFYPSQTLHQNTNMQGPGYSNQVFENYFPMKKINLVGALEAGATISKKMDISIISNFPSELKDNYNTTKLHMQESSLRFNVSYFF